MIGNGPPTTGNSDRVARLAQAIEDVTARRPAVSPPRIHNRPNHLRRHGHRRARILGGITGRAPRDCRCSGYGSLPPRRADARTRCVGLEDGGNVKTWIAVVGLLILGFYLVSEVNAQSREERDQDRGWTPSVMSRIGSEGAKRVLLRSSGRDSSGTIRNNRRRVAGDSGYRALRRSRGRRRLFKLIAGGGLALAAGAGWCMRRQKTPEADEVVSGSATTTARFAKHRAS